MKLMKFQKKVFYARSLRICFRNVSNMFLAVVRITKNKKKITEQNVIMSILELERNFVDKLINVLIFRWKKFLSQKLL